MLIEIWSGYQPGFRLRVNSKVEIGLHRLKFTYYSIMTH